MSLAQQWFERWICHPRALDVYQLLREDMSSWRLDIGGFMLQHKSGVAIWICNGWWFSSIHYPKHIKLGLLGRTMVWCAAGPVLRMAERDRRFWIDLLIDQERSKSRFGPGAGW